MKKRLLFCTDAWFYFIEIPPIILLVISCIYTGRVDNPFGLIPLILALCAFIVFIFLFFLRFISFSFSEVNCKGPFSSRDRAVINEGKKLIFTLKKGGRIDVALFGNDGLPPMYDGLDTPIDIYLLRGKAIGGRAALSHVLTFYGVDKTDLSNIFKKESFDIDYDYVSLESIKKEDIRVVTLTFKETV